MNVNSTLRDALLRLCIQMRPMDGPLAVIRTDPAPGFKALVSDKLLYQHRITLELGHAKNTNKNPVAEKAIQELEAELLRQDPLGGAVSLLTLAIATAALNSRIRSRGLSSREMWTQRDQFSNTQLPVGDNNLIVTQHEHRLKNHPYSEYSKAPLAAKRPTSLVEVGDLVYLHSDRNKSRARDRYLVVSVDPPFCNVRKFIGSQLRSLSYRVKLSECFKVPSDVIREYPRVCHSDNSADEEETHAEQHQVPPSPEIPDAISTPAIHSYHQHADPYASEVSPEDPNSSINDQDQTSDKDQQPAVSEPKECIPATTSEPRRSSRSRKPPKRFMDYVTDF